MNNKITNYSILETTAQIMRYDLYVVKDPNRLKAWLLKLLIKLKVLDYCTVEVPVYNKIVIERDKVINLIKDIQDEIYYSTRKKPKMVIMGNDQIEKLRVEIYESFRFPMTINLDGSDGSKIFDLEIVLNPRIDGVVVV